MSNPYVPKARGRDPYTLYCYNVHCLDISNVPTEFNVTACVKSQNNTQKSTAPTIESRINVHGQTPEHTVCKNAYNNKGAQWLSGRVLDSRPKGRGFEPHRRHCVVVLEQDTFILA